MKRVTLFLSLIVILALGLTALPAQAQGGDPEAHPLIQMLSMTPANAATPNSWTDFREIIYADLRAAEAARPGVPTPATWAEFEALEGKPQELWMANVSRLITLAPDMQALDWFDADMVNYLGLDYFEIDRSLAYLPAPNEGAIYGGHFDIDRISNTLIQRTYTATELNGVPVVCGPAGCENGVAFGNWLPDQEGRDPETLRHPGTYLLFGGRMGQQQPLALLPGYILSTPDWEILGQMTAAATDSGDSLYDLPEYRAVADFAAEAENSGTGRTLIQVLFFSPVFFNPDMFDLMADSFKVDVTPAELEAAFARVGIDKMGKPLEAEDLPPYTLGAIVDWQEGADQVHSIVLVYDTQSDAESAADEVTWRIPQQTAYLEWQIEQPLLEVKDLTYTLDPSQTVYNTMADRWLAVATVRSPLPGNDPDPANDDHIWASGRALLRWYRSWLSNTFSPVQLTP